MAPLYGMSASDNNQTTTALLAGMPTSDNNKTTISNIKNRKKQLFLTLFASVLLIAAVIGIIAGKSIPAGYHSSDIKAVASAHAIIKSTCSSTLYPDLCYSTVTVGAPELSKKVTSPKDVIELAVKFTVRAVERNYFTIKNISSRKNLTKREKVAVHDCLELAAVTLEELQKVVKGLEDYPAGKSIRQHASDLKTFLSSTITNHDTCLDGFSYDKKYKRVLEGVVDGEIHSKKMCSNALAMVKNLTDYDMVKEVRANYNGWWKLKMVEEEGGVTWPEWLSVGDRRLLQSGTVTPNVVVAADGSGDYTTVSAAVAAAPSRSTSRYVIGIRAGVYRENVDIPSSKTNLMFIGDGRITTIITANRSVAGGSSTFNSATVAAVGGGFLARDITFQNTAGPSGDQAVALRVGSDLSAFYRCGMIAYQDTLYVHSNRQFYVNCYIAGTVDFIFGNAATVLQDCDINARLPGPRQRNMVTAQGRTDPNQNTGIVIQKCRIGATSDLQPVQASFPTFLGRPWKLYSRTIVMQSTIGDVIDPAGWAPWNGDFALATLYYAEYQNTGPGADTSQRVPWSSVITSASEAQSYTPGSFIDGGNWLGSTGFPFSLGL